MHRPSVLLAIAATALATSSASAATIGATVVDASSGDYTLTSVSVTRGAAGTFTYEPSQLANVALTDVDAFSVPLQTSRGAALPAPGSRATLIEDWRLDTGLANVTTTNGAADRSVEVIFSTPIINSIGEDILLFENGGDDGVRWWVNGDREGRGATLTTANYSGTLLSSIPTTNYRFSRDGDANVYGLADLESPTGFTFDADATATIRVLGLDLSAVGVPLGGSVTSIRFQSVANAGGRVDPVLIVGLPAVPEPASAVAVMAALVLIGRPRRV